MKLTNLAALIMSVILSASAILVSSCNDQSWKEEHKEEIAALRFQQVGTFKYDLWNEARIMLDTETGITYMYVPTRFNGGRSSRVFGRITNNLGTQNEDDLITYISNAFGTWL